MALKVVGSNPIIHPIKNTEAVASVFFMAIMGFEEAGPTVGGAKNMPVACFLGRGRIHGQVTHPVGMMASAHQYNEKGLVLLQIVM